MEFVSMANNKFDCQGVQWCQAEKKKSELACVKGHDEKHTRQSNTSSADATQSGSSFSQ
jgi:hypothetical protein